MKDVIFVESPTKAKTLSRFLKGRFVIEASMGHIRDLPKGKLGIDIEKNFEPSYVIPKDKRKTVEHLKDLVKNAATIILATDPDREGEAISYHLQQILYPVKNTLVFKRIAFHEITEQAIKEALENPRTVDKNLVSAQTARRILDRIVGYKLSPMLWKKIKRGLSAGRVQSIALRLMVEREKEIAAFETKPYFRIFAVLAKSASAAGVARATETITSESKINAVDFELTLINQEKVETSTKIKLYDGDYTYKQTILDKKKSAALKAELSSLTYTVADVVQKDFKRTPYPPFITSSLQQEASRRLGFASRRTMSTAQKLYEEGFITYHRTDSFNLSSQFTTRAHIFIKNQFGERYLKPRSFKTKSKVAQEAHEAIRPTDIGEISNIKNQISKILGNDSVRLYELIYKRSLATQMADAQFKSTKIMVKANGKAKYTFERSGSVLVFDGFLKLWFYEEQDNILPVYKVGDQLNFENANATEHSTNPPPRYNEASLIGSLEKNGIGRPSTYATILGTIQDRAYVEKVENRFIPTKIGVAVNDFLVKNFEDIDDIPFTARMENSLDEIANGQKEWVPMMKEFYTPFEKDLQKAENEAKVEVAEEKTGRICPKCNQGELIVKRSRFGKFIACNKYPDCDYKENITEDLLILCPKDEGKIVMRRTRRGRTFFGCNNYPKCDFAVWTKEQLMKQGKPVSPAQIPPAETSRISN